MRTRFLVVVLAAVGVAGLVPGRADAHDLQLIVCLPADSPTVLTILAGFDDDTPAEGAKVVITDAAGAVVIEAKTDETGVCKLTRPGPGKYTAVVEALGHRDEVPFEIVDMSGGEYRGWRPNKAVGLAVGTGGLLAVSGAYWWFRQRKAA